MIFTLLTLSYYSDKCSKYLKWIFVPFLNIFILYSVSGQEIKTNGTRNSSVSSVECVDSEFGFLVEGKFYKNKDKVFACKGVNLDVLLVQATTLTPVTNPPINATNIIFSGNVTDIAPGDAFAQVIPENFNNSGKATVKVTFYSGGSDNSLELSFFLIKEKNVSVHETDSHTLAAYGFDENEFPNYPNSTSGLPSKFLPAQENDKVKLTSNLSGVSKTKVFNTISLSDLTPDHLLYGISGDELELTHIHSETQNSFTVKACAPDISLMEVDIYPSKTMTVEIYTLCESDDDVINYCNTNPSLLPDCSTPISSATHECILPGADLTLDRYLDHAFWREQNNDPTKPSDVLDFSPAAYHELKILPSYNPATNRYFCNKRPQPSNVAPCPDLLTPAELSTIQSDLNTIYNQAGIQVTVIDKGYKNFNFDNKFSDDNGIDISEQNYLHWAFVNYQGIYPLNMMKSANTIIWRVNNIIYSGTGIAYGRATPNIRNSLLINVTTGAGTFRTISHELGHAKYGLAHPDEDWVTDGLKGPVNNDQYNLMNSGPLYQNYTVESISDFRIRRYQWNKIQLNH